MASLWRKRKSGKKTKPEKIFDQEIVIPAHFRCPISLDLMKDPVTVSTGITYDRQSIEKWLEIGNTTCPVTNQEIKEGDDFIPNHSLRKMIQEWCVAKRPYGIERIPTPKIPMTGPQAAEMLSEVMAASRRADAARCRQLVGKVKALAKESERNLRCFASNGGSRVLAASFSAFAAADSPMGILEDIIATMASMFPLDEEAVWFMSAPDSLTSILSILNHGDLAGRLHAVLMVKEILTSISGDRVDLAAKTEGLVEPLAKLIKQPISSQTTKASLVSIFHMVDSNESTASKFVELGMFPLLIEMIVDAEKSMCEKALAVLDGLLSCENGRDEAYIHALTMPALVKKMFRVSDMATEFAVSAVWKLCKKYKEGEEKREECLVQALQVGVFQKLLLLLQVGCSVATKEKATELLKLLNGYRGIAAECIDTTDFKGLKRSS